jgi:hypothetical protein
LNAALIRKLRARDPYCVHCGLDRDLVPHHRRNRAMGGSKILDRLDNLLMVCAAYNGAMESDAAIAGQARDLGHKLSSWQTFDSPVFDKVAGLWFVLTSDGRKEATEPPQYLI